ncbi:MAG: phosphatidylglycerophosphatase A [Candidatus Dactylopiibacterium sp.]|nr:phosphatidylglycerophosphatase A [Candidatus Dactylopiibacterium sp.]
MRPTFRLLVSHPAHFVSLGFGAGLAPRAPGTVGSFVAWALFAAGEACLPAWPVWLAALALTVAFVAGAACIARTGRALGEVDHGAIVWDEFVAVWLVLWLIPSGWAWQLAGVLVFRFFDILKPWPIRAADRRFKHGPGVMFDDLLAALFSLACLFAVAALI